MKRQVLFFSLCSVLLLCFSCQDDMVEEIMIQEKAMTRSNSSWMNCTEGILRSGECVNLPWANSIKTVIPDDVRTDIAEEDGWRILYSNIDFIGYDVKVSTADQGVNYLLFYNKYTGILKGFIYEEGYIGKNQYAFLELSARYKTTMFNFANNLAQPMDSKDSPQNIVLSLVSKNGFSQGFEKGWNCFMTELAYDENSMDNELSVTGFIMEEPKYTFTGAYESTSSGTIVTAAQKKSDLIDGVATGFGQAGKEWIKEEIGTDVSKAIKFGSTVLQSVMDKGITGIISTGLYKVFGSLLGTTKTNYDLNFKTEGSITITGNSSAYYSGLITPLSGIPLNGLGYNLGVWNLETTPISTMNGLAELQYRENTLNGTNYFYKVKHTPSMKIKINPAIQKNVTSKIDIVECIGNMEAAMVGPEGCNRMAHRVSSSDGNIIYADDSIKLAEYPITYNIVLNNVLPDKTMGSSTPALCLRDNKYHIDDRVIFKVSTTVHGDNTVYSVKTFIPKFQYDAQSARPYKWTSEELKAKGY